MSPSKRPDDDGDEPPRKRSRTADAGEERRPENGSGAHDRSLLSPGNGVLPLRDSPADLVQGTRTDKSYPHNGHTSSMPPERTPLQQHPLPLGWSEFIHEPSGHIIFHHVESGACSLARPFQLDRDTPKEVCPRCMRGLAS